MRDLEWAHHSLSMFDIKWQEKYWKKKNSFADLKIQYCLGPSHRVNATSPWWRIAWQIFSMDKLLKIWLHKNADGSLF